MNDIIKQSFLTCVGVDIFGHKWANLCISTPIFGISTNKILLIWLIMKKPFEIASEKACPHDVNITYIEFVWKKQLCFMNSYYVGYLNKVTYGINHIQTGWSKATDTTWNSSINIWSLYTNIMVNGMIKQR